MRLKIVTLISLLPCFFQANAQPHYELDGLIRVFMLPNRALYVNIDFREEFSKIGKDAIPLLIDAIDTNEHGPVGYIYDYDSKSSRMPPLYKMRNHVGIWAAYMIDYILVEKEFEKAYPNCIILKSKNGEPVMEPLKYKDMRKIKKIYQKWWNKNKSKSLEELKCNWLRGDHPLKGSQFMWI